MKKRLFALVLAGTMVFSVGCGKETTTSKTQETKNTIEETQTTVSTTATTEESEAVEEQELAPVSSLSVDDVTTYIYSHEYKEGNDMTETAEQIYFTPYMDYLVADFYWFDQAAAKEVIFAEFTEEAKAEEFFTQYDGAASRVENNSEGDIQFITYYLSGSYLYDVKVGNSVLIMTEIAGDTNPSLEIMNGILNTHFEVNVSDVAVLETANEYFLTVGVTEMSFKFNPDWEILEADDSHIKVQINEDLSVVYSDSNTAIDDEDSFNAVFSQLDGFVAFTFNGKESYFGSTYVEDVLYYLIYQDFGGDHYLMISVQALDESLSMENDILPNVLFNY